MYEYLGGLPRVLNMFSVIIEPVPNFNDPARSILKPSRDLGDDERLVWFTVLPNRAKSLLFASKKA